MATKNKLIQLTKAFVEELKDLDYETLAPFVYNPLEYAHLSFDSYLLKYGAPKKKAVFLGMNPGPYGMAQTGIPFGEVSYVKNWLKVNEPVMQPKKTHPKRPVLGFACTRSEVSGRRLWGYFSAKHEKPEVFFKDYFVINYCPLIFFDEAGKNLTPDKLPKAKAQKLFAACDHYLRETVKILEPKYVIGVGQFAKQRAEIACNGLKVTYGSILHPSPANPQANAGWAKTVNKQLTELGIS